MGVVNGFCVAEILTVHAPGCNGGAIVNIDSVFNGGGVSGRLNSSSGGIQWSSSLKYLGQTPLNWPMFTNIQRQLPQSNNARVLQAALVT